MDVDPKTMLAIQVCRVLDGTSPCPVGCSVAEVALIPKIKNASAPGAFRPVTVLLVLLKVTMRCWLYPVEPYLRLRRLPSHGFRPGFQAAEAHWSIRTLMQKYGEFGMKVVVSKLDIYKAYDTLKWESIEASFERRGMPQALRDAYWRTHRARALRFRTPDGAVQFSVVPQRGIPQGAPESPAVYAPVMEDLIAYAEGVLLASGRPAGLRLQPEEDLHAVEALKTPKQAMGSDAVCFLFLQMIHIYWLDMCACLNISTLCCNTP